MNLQKYWEKRKFKETSEPRGKISKSEKKRFVIQEHWATHHHFDFRLEMEGVLKSWAVPKGVPEEAGIKRLAIQTEDHPTDYVNFKGIIPEGLYGAGKVEIYDEGSYELVNKTPIQIEFKLLGKKIRGDYRLVKFREPNQWLLFKQKQA